MAIHINMTPEAEAELRKTALRNRLASMLICLLCITLGGAALYFSVIMLEGEKLTSFIGYTPPADDAPPTTTPKVQQLSPRPASPTNSVAPNVIVSTSASAVAMADVDVPISDVNFGTGAEIELDMGASLGTEIGDDGVGLGTSKAGGSTLEGTLYDLKMTKAGAPSDMSAPNTHLSKVPELLGDFIKRDWSSSIFSKYYSSSTKLYAGSFYLPSCSADYAPFAFNCSDRVKPNAWVVIYRGKVTAPKSGKFRFVGTGDDTLAVRFNRKTVLEAGWCIPSLKKSHIGFSKEYRKEISTRKRNPVTFYQYPEITKWNNELGGLRTGDVFEVKEGRTYPIEILISEIPGGYFGFALLIQDMTDPTNKKASNGSPILQLFRTNFQEPTKKSLEAALRTPKKNFVPEGGIECPPYDPDSLIWTAVP